MHDGRVELLCLFDALFCSIFKICDQMAESGFDRRSIHMIRGESYIFHILQDFFHCKAIIRVHFCTFLQPRSDGAEHRIRHYHAVCQRTVSQFAQLTNQRDEIRVIQKHVQGCHVKLLCQQIFCCVSRQPQCLNVIIRMIGDIR